MNDPIIRFLREHPSILFYGIAGLTVTTLLLTLVPADYMIQSGFWSYDKLGHALLFGVWTFLFGIYQMLNHPNLAHPFIIFTTGILFGGLIELLQYLLPIGRNADWIDLGVDAIGAFLAITVIHFFFESPSE